MSPDKASNIIEKAFFFIKYNPITFYTGVFVVVVLLLLFLFFIKPKKVPGARTPLVKNTKTRYKQMAVVSFILLFLFSLIGILNFNNKYNIVENPLISESEYVFGIDVSHYQGKISWERVVQSKHPIKFVFVRATMGEDGRDKKYLRNWVQSKKKGYLRGAYHYYRPNENSTAQFKNFVKRVKLEKGDFPPVLDIEEESDFGTGNLRKGILNWLKLAEEHYKVRPIIYTGRSFYKSYLKGHVEQYPLWIASYSGKHKLRGIDWTMHQFTEEVKVKGIPEMVDGNDFNGNMEELKAITLK